MFKKILCILLVIFFILISSPSFSQPILDPLLVASYGILSQPLLRSGSAGLLDCCTFPQFGFFFIDCPCQVPNFQSSGIGYNPLVNPMFNPFFNLTNCYYDEDEYGQIKMVCPCPYCDPLLPYYPLLLYSLYSPLYNNLYSPYSALSYSFPLSSNYGYYGLGMPYYNYGYGSALIDPFSFSGYSAIPFV